MSPIHYPDLRASVAADPHERIEGTVEIALTGDGFELRDGRNVLARSPSAKALSRFAFDRGAVTVRRAYDLRFER